MYAGSVIETFQSNNKKLSTDHFPDVFVTVGTAPFPRLVNAMDKISGDLGIKTIMQTGTSRSQALNSECFEFCDYTDIIRLMRNAKIVIVHAGVGSILSALSQNSKLIVVPRQLSYGEVNDNHQLEIASVLSQDGVSVCNEITELRNLVIMLLNDQSGSLMRKGRRDNVPNQLVNTISGCINRGTKEN